MSEVFPWIAVVDDDPAVLRALSRLLRSHGYNVHTYGSAKEFLDALPDGHPTCLIVDLQMPAMGGQELQEQLIQMGLNIPTIMITAHHDATPNLANLRLAALLLKPLQESALLAAIDRAINVPREDW